MSKNKLFIFLLFLVSAVFLSIGFFPIFAYTFGEGAFTYVLPPYSFYSYTIALTITWIGAIYTGLKKFE